MYPDGRKWTGTTWVNTMERLNFPICPAKGKPFELMDSGASHMLLPLSTLKGKDLEEATRIRVNLAMRGGELRCPDGKKTHLLMRFSTKGNMQYVTENQFEILRQALWTSAINS
eukprot:6301284-Amphidinium_carterae.1